MKHIDIPSKDCEMESHGFVYVAINQGSDPMAAKSARSLKNHVKDAHVTIFSDQNPSDGVWDYVVRVPSKVQEFNNQPQYPCQGIVSKLKYFIRSPYKQTVFLDIDTFVVSDISDLFEILEPPYNIDWAARVYEAHCPMPTICNIEIPHCLPRFNTGVMVYKKSPLLTKFHDDAWSYAVGSPGDHWTEEPFVSLSAYTTQGLRTASLPEEYNTRFIFPFILRTETRILHGRSDAHQDVANKINSHGGFRVMFESQLLEKYEAGHGLRRF